MSDVAIRIRGLGKRYVIGAREEQHDTLRDRIAAAATRPFRRLAPGGFAESTTIWALKDITHEIHRGDVVGVHGQCAQQKDDSGAHQPDEVRPAADHGWP